MADETSPSQAVIEEIVAQTRLTCSCSAAVARRAARSALSSLGTLEGRVLGILERTASDATDEITVAEAARLIRQAFRSALPVKRAAAGGAQPSSAPSLEIAARRSTTKSRRPMRSHARPGR